MIPHSLTDVQDSSGSHSYTYSKRRQITRHSITLNGLAPQTLSYGYGKGGRLSRISYPSGRTATYSYRADGTLSQLRTTYGGTTQTVVKTTWNPTGQPTKLTYGNALVERRSYDLAGQLTQLHRNALGKLSYAYDTVGNITQIGTQTYAYDALDRLTQAPSRSYAYDANGNRTQDTGQSYVLAPDSNRLHQGAGRVYDYDANGNPMSDGRYSYTYDSQNRLSTVQQGATVQVRSTYNALGQRVRKESPAGGSPTGTTHYLYSTEGQLLAELDAQGNTHREYLYLHAWPVAVVSYTPAVPASSGTVALLAGDAAAETAEDYPEVAETAPADPKPTTSTGVTTSGTSDRAADGVAASAGVIPAIQLHYLHPDHLGTPRLATDSAQRIVWRWDSAPFGDTPALEDPDGDGVRVTLNLRFPGQYFDAETGLHYNYFRDYDPVVGRYLESDPIGLRGGVNTYGYVNGRPLTHKDFLGLEPGLLKICCDVITTGMVGNALGYLFGASHCYVQTPSGTVYEYGQEEGAKTYNRPPDSSPPKDCFLCIPKACNDADTDPEICAGDFSHRYGTKLYHPGQTSNTFISRLVAHCCDRLVGDVTHATRGAQGY